MADTSLNDQIRDAVASTAAALRDGDEPLARAVASQMLALAAGLAMHDAVAQQRHAHLLQNAAVSALVRGLLDADAERLPHLVAALREVRETFAPRHLVELLEQLRRLVESQGPVRASAATSTDATRTAPAGSGAAGGTGADGPTADVASAAPSGGRSRRRRARAQG